MLAKQGNRDRADDREGVRYCAGVRTDDSALCRKSIETWSGPLLTQSGHGPLGRVSKIIETSDWAPRLSVLLCSA